MRNPSAIPSPVASLADILDRKSLVLDIACMLQAEPAAFAALIEREDVDGLLSILSPTYGLSGIPIDFGLVQEAVKAVAKGSFLFAPRIHPLVARVARLLLTREQWWKRSAGVLGALVLSLLLILISVHFVRQARYDDWAGNVAASGRIASDLRQDAALYANQAAQLSGTPAGMRIHAQAALALLATANHALNGLYVNSDDPASLRATYYSTEGSAKTLLNEEVTAIRAIRGELRRAQSEISLAQQIRDLAQKWSRTDVPADLPGGLSTTWQTVAQSLRAGLNTGDINAVQAADHRLTFIHASGRDEVAAAASIQTMPETARASATFLLASIDEDVDSNNASRVTQTMAAFHALQARIGLDYTVKLIVSPGMKSGVERAIQGVGSSPKYYLLAQAIDPSGKPVAVPVVDTETQVAQSVEDFGIEVSKDVFEAIRSRKEAGEKSITLGVKPAGYADPVYNIPVLTGTITHW